MQLEKYLDFSSEDAIRVAGTRVGIEAVVGDYQQGASPEEIALHYPTLSLAQIYAVIAYYLANQGQVEAYLQRVYRQREVAWQTQQRQPSAFVRSLRRRLEEQRRGLTRSETTARL